MGWLVKSPSHGYHLQWLVTTCRASVRVVVFNATVNNISVKSWGTVSLMVNTVVPGENHRPATSNLKTLSDTVVSSTPRHERDSISQL
jgi:hypothetical protein